MVLVDVLIFLAASILLVKSASYGVKSISKIATNLRFSQFFVAFVIAGFVSVMPEMFIAINSSLANVPTIGLGTIIGANVADLTLLLGLVALVGKKIKVDKKTLNNNTYFVVIVALPILLMLDGILTQDDGLILVLAFGAYMWHIIHKEQIFLKSRRRMKGTWKQLVIFLVAMVVLFTSAHFMVEAGISIAEAVNTPALLIGLLIIALGTTLPELTFSLRAAISRHKEIALGDLLGNVAIDSTLVIGIIALITPVTSNFVLVISGAMFMVLAALVAVTLMQSGKAITWRDSFLLFFIYVMFIAIELTLKGLVVG